MDTFPFSSPPIMMVPCIIGYGQPQPLPLLPTHLNIQSHMEKEYVKAVIRYREYSIQFQQRQLQQFQQRYPCPLNFVVQKNEEKPFPASYQAFCKETVIPICKTEEEPSFKVEYSECDSGFSPKVEEEVATAHKPQGNFLKDQIVQMLFYFLNEFGKINQGKSAEQRQKYLFNPSLLSLFDALAARYISASKCREDMIRFVLRKALSFLRDSLRNKHNLTAKAASLAFCQRYFDNKFEEMVRDEVNIDDEKEVLNFLLPYKKNSRNRTANNCFITEIFTSEVFYQDYLGYLERFDEIMKADNEKKMKKFVDFLYNCVKENSLEKVKKFKRLPWLMVWLETSKVIAYELLNTNILKGFHKKQKTTQSKKQSDDNQC